MDTMGKLVVFIGTTPNIGTTLISFGLAAQLARETNQRVGYICLNLKSSKLHRYVGMDEAVTTLDSIRADMKSRTLRRERLLRHCDIVKGVPNMHVMYGNMLREQAEFFVPEDIEYLLQVARDTFDICIVEVNAYWDNAATVSALLQADARIAVTTEELTHFQEDMERWLRTMAPLFNISLQSFELIVNQMTSKKYSEIGVKDIYKETGMSVIAKIERYSDITAFLNQGKLVELVTNKHPLSQSLHMLANQLIQKWKLTRSDRPKNRIWLKRTFWRWAAGKKGAAAVEGK